MVLMLIITFTACAVAITMTVLAWRVLREDRRRMDARVAALAAEIDDGSSNRYTEFALSETPHVPVDHLFANADTDDGPRRPRLAAIVGGGALVVGTIVALLLFVTSGAHPAASSAPKKTVAAPTAPPTGGSPLELVALGHEREDNRLTVRGVIRNPSGGHAITNLTAVVLLFNQQGGFVTSGRATIDGALSPGGEVPFAVTVPGAADVGRYRVSFRTDERIVPHVDRRS